MTTKTTTIYRGTINRAEPTGNVHTIQVPPTRFMRNIFISYNNDSRPNATAMALSLTLFFSGVLIGSDLETKRRKLPLFNLYITIYYNELLFVMVNT